jgi:hypothetical protein
MNYYHQQRSCVGIPKPRLRGGGQDGLAGSGTSVPQAASPRRFGGPQSSPVPASHDLTPFSSPAIRGLTSEDALQHPPIPPQPS